MNLELSSSSISATIDNIIIIYYLCCNRMQRSGHVDCHKEYGRRDDSGESDLNDDDNAVSSFLLVDEKEKIMVKYGCVYIALQ